MDRKTFNALKLSIDKFKRFSVGTSRITDRLGVDGCPLCKVHLRWERTGNVCGDCPVKLHTSMPLCRGTPYIQISKYCEKRRDNSEMGSYDFSDIIKEEKFRKLCQKEAEFLTTLLPEKSKGKPL